MAQVEKTTLMVQYLEEFDDMVVRHAMEAFCNETVRLINFRLKDNAKDKEAFEASVTYGWFQVPEEPGLYCIQVIGAHFHHDVRSIGTELQSTADERGFPMIVNVLRQ